VHLKKCVILLINDHKILEHDSLSSSYYLKKLKTICWIIKCYPNHWFCKREKQDSWSKVTSGRISSHRQRAKEKNVLLIASHSFCHLRTNYMHGISSYRWENAAVRNSFSTMLQSICCLIHVYIQTKDCIKVWIP
jgi:hypothetical protein